MTRSRTTLALTTFVVLAFAGASAWAADPGASPPTEGLAPNGAKPVAEAPGVRRVIGMVSGSACDARYDLQRGEAEALKLLQARALAHGGDGVASVRFTQVTNTRSPCWHGVEATGLAVAYAHP